MQTHQTGAIQKGTRLHELDLHTATRTLDAWTNYYLALAHQAKIQQEKIHEADVVAYEEAYFNYNIYNVNTHELPSSAPSKHVGTQYVSPESLHAAAARVKALRVHIESLLNSQATINEQDRYLAEESLAKAYRLVFHQTEAQKWSVLALQHRQSYESKVDYQRRLSIAQTNLEQGIRYYTEAKNIGSSYHASGMEQKVPESKQHTAMDFFRQAARHFDLAAQAGSREAAAKLEECNYQLAGTSEEKLTILGRVRDLRKDNPSLIVADIPESKFSTSDLLMKHVLHLSGFNNDLYNAANGLPILLRAYHAIREKENNTLRLFQPLKKKLRAVNKLLDHLENKSKDLMVNIDFSEKDIDALCDKRVREIITPFKNHPHFPAAIRERLNEKKRGDQKVNHLLAISVYAAFRHG